MLNNNLGVPQLALRESPSSEPEDSEEVLLASFGFWGGVEGWEVAGAMI